ncbi:TonB-dependent receptor [Candidatus Poribacteria bacterium]|nr:TonB-dependent receptor [Candidatus Poribacteria bacterium]
MFFRPGLLIIVIFCFSAFNQITEAADEETTESTVQLPPITVTATRSEMPIDAIPAAVGTVDKTAIQLGRQTIGLDESLNRIPGLFVQNRYNYAQDLRISIRGFGARAAFGVRGIKLLVDGIPETTPDGQSQVDNIDLGSTERIEVIRGATSSLYGNASGGVISLITESGPEKPFVEFRPTIGAFGLAKYQLKTGGQSGNLNYLLNFSRMEISGFREHSRTENLLLNSKVRFTIDSASDLTMVVNFVNSPTAMDPGSLTREQVDADRNQAAARNVSLDAGESVMQGRIGSIYRRRLSEGHEVSVTLYGLFRDFSQALPLDRAVDFDRFSAGGGVKYSFQGNLFGLKNRLTTGIDLQYQDDDRRNFDNPEGKPGETLQLHQNEEVTSLGVFLYHESQLHEAIRLTLGLRYDRLHFAVADFLFTNGDDSGKRTFDSVSPLLGLVWSPLSNLNLYGNISTAFETPTTTELANRPTGEGGFNPDLDAQHATNYEVGLKGGLKRFHYDLALFSISVKDELIPFEVPTVAGRRFFRNAGSSTHNGLEFGFQGIVFEGLTASVAYTYSNFRFNDFKTEDAIFDDNYIPGIPPHQLHAELFYRHLLGISGGLELTFVDDFFVDDANTEQNDSYAVINFRLSYARTIGRWQVAPFIGLNNLLDRAYNASVRVNAFGQRYFEPAPGRSIHAGTTIYRSF